MKMLQGRIVLKDRIVTGSLSFDHCLREIDTKSLSNKDPEYCILPGFIDGHVHGGNGADTMDGAEGIKKLSKFHMQHGTTTILPTTITRPWNELIDTLRALKEVQQSNSLDLPDIRGAHLEGPFISEKKLGAQPAFTLCPTPSKIQELIDLNVVRVITMAPEIEQIDQAIPLLTKAGIRISLGHTTCNYDQACHAINTIHEHHGTSAGTHLFNAMGGIEGRTPGLVGALLDNDKAYAEMIFDTHHVHPVNFRLAHHLLPDRLLFITDAMRGAGMKEGVSELGGQKVIIKDGQVMGMNGHLAGSILTLDQAFRNAVTHGATLPEATKLLSTNAAHYQGLTDRGEISVGKRADLVVMNTKLQIEQVWVAGHRMV